MVNARMKKGNQTDNRFAIEFQISKICWISDDSNDYANNNTFILVGILCVRIIQSSSRQLQQQQQQQNTGNKTGDTNTHNKHI